MSEQAPEQPQEEQPQEEPTTTPPPEPNKGSGQFAVFDHDLSQFVSGVSNKKDADASKKALKAHNGAITDGHRLEVLEV